MKRTKFRPLLVRLLPTEYKRLERFAKAENTPMAHIVRELILNYCTDFRID